MPLFPTAYGLSAHRFPHEILSPLRQTPPGAADIGHPGDDRCSAARRRSSGSACSACPMWPKFISWAKSEAAHLSVPGRGRSAAARSDRRGVGDAGHRFSRRQSPERHAAGRPSPHQLRVAELVARHRPDRQRQHLQRRRPLSGRPGRDRRFSRGERRCRFRREEHQDRERAGAVLEPRAFRPRHDPQRRLSRRPSR